MCSTKCLANGSLGFINNNVRLLLTPVLWALQAPAVQSYDFFLEQLIGDLPRDDVFGDHVCVVGLELGHPAVAFPGSGGLAGLPTL